jgi:hypothetical protein
MIKPASKSRPVTFLNDFQVFKGQTHETMKPFGAPVTVAHEAHMLIRDDQRKSVPNAIYAIHQRSQNRILRIIEPTLVQAQTLPKAA